MAFQAAATAAVGGRWHEDRLLPTQYTIAQSAARAGQDWRMDDRESLEKRLVSHSQCASAQAGGPKDVHNRPRLGS